MVKQKSEFLVIAENSSCLIIPLRDFLPHAAPWWWTSVATPGSLRPLWVQIQSCRGIFIRKSVCLSRSLKKTHSHELQRTHLILSNAIKAFYNLWPNSLFYYFTVWKVQQTRTLKPVDLSVCSYVAEFLFDSEATAAVIWPQDTLSSSEAFSCMDGKLENLLIICCHSLNKDCSSERVSAWEKYDDEFENLSFNVFSSFLKFLLFLSFFLLNIFHLYLSFSYLSFSTDLKTSQHEYFRSLKTFYYRLYVLLQDLNLWCWELVNLHVPCVCTYNLWYWAE